jgi:hypothetical protein
MSAKLKHSDINLFEFTSSIKPEEEPVSVSRRRMISSWSHLM